MLNAPVLTSIIRSTRDHTVACAHCREVQELSPATMLNPERSLMLMELFALDHSGCVQYAGQVAMARSHRRFVREMRKLMPMKRSA